jgi:hypothetical protein
MNLVEFESNQYGNTNKNYNLHFFEGNYNLHLLPFILKFISNHVLG